MSLPPMTKEAQAAYKDALRRIEECRLKGKEGTVLDLTRLGLTQVPPEIGQLSELTQLRLPLNQLTSLPPEIGKLTALTQLYLSNNQLTSLPPEIGKLSALRELRLLNNQLSRLHPQLGLLPALYHLSVSGNPLPAELLMLNQNQLIAYLRQQAKETHAGYNEALERIEACRRKGKEGTFLDLSNLGLTEVPPEIGQLCALTDLHLSMNNLASLPAELGQLSTLVDLRIFANQLTSLPAEIGNLCALTRLQLFTNQLTCLPPKFGQLSALLELDLDNNRLASLPPEIGQLSALRELFLDSNQLTSLPPEIGQLSALSALHLDSNQLTSLPPETGQLSALRELYLDNNQLTSLPPEIGQIPVLEYIFVDGNPLPDELLRLVQKDQLIPYLRQLAEENALPALFNEAKLLLVGPGNVGKSWLLRALQGEVPKLNEPTRGMEIARVPVTLPHPSEAGRKLCLNAWDFGGQDHYQITHQIFFSAKAVYLLVWKPRNGVDPDLSARLERIQLSAGRSAKVLIVSTHADGSVPAIIGQDALKETFGDMIGGFYEVDSAKGAEGTGIAALQAAIAQSAAQLEGMDTPFPKTWHAAQTAIRKLKSPTVTLKQFAETCAKKDLDAESAAALASIMEVQGHAVFFADAAQDAEACLNAEGNLVVLDPEWLAKAVGFVLEDKPTMQQYGILSHARLEHIWKEDKHRHCPGYAKDLHGFLLWLMWKFDIAYKQTDQTSLVPELIQRNRPDNLRWTPTHTTREPEATLICRIPQDPPVGIIPALTAAVHPLRRRQPGDDHAASQDKLDRNWRDGFFLDSALRGEAFVELVDRDLKIVVRDEYPSNLLKEIQNTLGEIVKQRWPRLELDLRVPCIGQVNGKPCRGTFSKEGLEDRLGEKAFCEVCKSRPEVKLMLEGFDPREQEVMQKLKELEASQNELIDGQREILESQRGLTATAHRFFLQALDPARRELERAPCMLTILPEEAGTWQILSRLTEQKVRITCWCEHPDGPHPAAVIGSGDAPDYVLTMPQTWLVKAAPYINWAATLLKAFVPMTGTLLQQSLGDNLTPDLKNQIALMNNAANALPGGKFEPGTRDEMEPTHRSRPEIVALRHIHDALMEQVKPGKRWGDLRPVSTKSGELLWLCAKHAAIQQPPVLNPSA